MKDKKRFISIVTVIVIAVMAVGFASVAVWYTYETEENKTTEMTSADKTPKWLSYTNDHFKYSVNYLSDWSLEYEEKKFTLTISQGPAETATTKVEFYAQANTRFQEFMNDYKSIYPEWCHTEEFVTLAEQEVTKLTCTDPEGQIVINYFLINIENTVYWINYIQGTEEINEAYEEIIATFSLIE